jgi:glycosyltransferase involved in cell wall biosynthesis
VHGCYGYSRVAKYVCKGLRDAGHNVIVIGTVTAGNLIRDEHGTPNIPAYFDAYAKYALSQYIRGFEIDCVVTILDCWTPVTHDIPDIVHRFKIPIVAHVTARSAPLSPWWLTYLQKCDHIVMPSWFGMELGKPFFHDRLSYIQHGVNTDIYKPDPEGRNELRKRLGYGDRFVFLSVGRNKGIQKRYDILLKAYKAFLMNVPDARGKTLLHIHAEPHESGAIDLEQMRDMGYHAVGKEHVRFSAVRFSDEKQKLEVCAGDDPRAMTLNPNWGLDEDEMARLYNIADCHVQSGEGESFCLPAMESQACGIPQIFPDHSIGPEMVGKPGSGLLVRIATEETTPILTDVALADPLDMAKCMERMYRDAELRRECSENAVKNSRNYGWKRVVEKWLFVIEKTGEPRLDYQRGLLGI